ncbi:uncharacterized protein EI90DRAFT_2231518 [Cantharellus anzutake]|uniref:uncharacterized protein n=1 Tax=Cantharellus anzutake TaxID=1750568 RepID=UPI0019072B96|nr:uncharacterized protein EI90DRAFT_2231518 [Cantharellus anzutake]KAF8324771.1 hypothetical protein EI90DRAFT_2231518 [Cantharellus anzutake]
MSLRNLLFSVHETIYILSIFSNLVLTALLAILSWFISFRDICIHSMAHAGFTVTPFYLLLELTPTTICAWCLVNYAIPSLQTRRSRLLHSDIPAPPRVCLFTRSEDQHFRAKLSARNNMRRRGGNRNTVTNSEWPSATEGFRYLMCLIRYAGALRRCKIAAPWYARCQHLRGRTGRIPKQRGWRIYQILMPWPPFSSLPKLVAEFKPCGVASRSPWKVTPI